MLIQTVRVALRRPYTFVVLALLLLIVGPLAALRTPTDIFPEIRIPVVAVAWQYTGLPPDQMAGRISTVFQRILTTAVNDVEHIEANTYPGVSVVKIFFQPGVDVAVANAQVTAASQVALRQMPPGIMPPVILNYNAATVPILQLALSGEGLSEQNLFDLGMNTVRTSLTTVPGAVIPLPYGGKQRQVQIDLNPSALQARGLSAPQEFPDATFSFPPADIVSQILNFGAPAPIDIQIRGANLEANFAYAQQLLKRIRAIPGVADARIQQSNKVPVFNVELDRTQAQLLGLTTRDVTNSLVVNLAGSSQVAPTYWLNPANGVSYPIVMQTPQHQLDSLATLENLPVGNGTTANAATLGGVARFERTTGNALISQYNVQPMVQIHATTQDRDLGAVAADLRRVLADTAADVPRGSTVNLLGQVQTMDRAFSGLLFGLLGAIVLIYLLIVVNFQSWLDPAVIISALSAALAGIVWMLFATNTTLSVPALTGAIMCMGVATANSVLVISFARERLTELGDATAAALEAGVVRFRPVLMTALAMIFGMLPMALGLGEGGEQNAPLGRAVIGGLLLATLATLMFVPVLFSLVHGRGSPHVSPAEPLPALGVS